MRAHCRHGAAWWREDCPRCAEERLLSVRPVFANRQEFWDAEYARIRAVIAEARAANPNTDKRFHTESFYLGAVMRKTQGRVNPGLVVKLLRETP